MDMPPMPPLYGVDSFSKEAVLALLDAGSAPCASLYVPTQRGWNKRNENRLRLQTLMSEAETNLAVQGNLGRDAKDLLASARSVVEDGEFWREATEGLALFCTRDHTSVHRLPFSVNRMQIVDGLFHIRPMWQRLAPDGTFFVLALARGGVQLFQASRYAMQRVELKDTPVSYKDALAFDEHIRSVRYHTKMPATGSSDRTKRASTYVGHEDVGDRSYVKEGTKRFLQQIDLGVCRILEQEASLPPLVLAGDGVARGLYRNVSHYAALSENDIRGEYYEGTQWDEPTLHEKGWRAVAQDFDEPRQNAVSRFHALAAAKPRRVATGIKTVFRAACDARVDVLFVSEDAQTWGRYDTGDGNVATHPAAAPVDVELYNAAMTHTLLSGGTVYATGSADVPDGGDIAAILRN